MTAPSAPRLADARRTTVQLDVAASPEAVFDVLDDAEAYARWVVGTRRVRDVDASWPAVSARFHHAVGTRAAELHDWSRVCERDRPRRLVLEVRFRPHGIAIVTIDVVPTAAGARVVLGESPTSGPAAWLPALVTGPVLRARNWLSLQRLRHEIERRADGARSD